MRKILSSFVSPTTRRDTKHCGLPTKPKQNPTRKYHQALVLVPVLEQGNRRSHPSRCTNLKMATLYIHYQPVPHQLQSSNT